MRFAKAHGTGNDFVVLPDPDGELNLSAASVIALCDRRRGIGADGVLRVVRSAKDPAAADMAGEAEWFMDYRNSDGSLAEMCGNGVRAFARYLVDAGLAADRGRLAVATRAGVVSVEVGPELISVDMPVPRVTGTGSAMVSGIAYSGTTVTVGNPNLVIVLPDEEALRRMDLSTQPTLSPAAFPGSANVEFIVPAEPLPGAQHVRMRVYERGAGETMSCGSGACAVAAAVLAGSSGLGAASGYDAASGLGAAAGRVVVDVPGGRLTIDLDASRCRLTGPAVIVATGETTLL
jgi:diaminopimelate epimerase